MGEIIGAPSRDSPASLCDHLCLLRESATGQALDSRDYKQLVTDVADKVRIDWDSVIGSSAWEALSSEHIEAAIIRHVEADKIYVQDLPSQLPDPIAALDDAFSSLSSDWRKLLAAVIYIHQVIRPAAHSTDDAPVAEQEPASDPIVDDAPVSQDHADTVLERKSGEELFRAGPENLGPNLLDFWRWSASDLLGDATLGVIAEFIVSRALGLDSAARLSSRGACDFLLNYGRLKIAVSSASCIQSGTRVKPASIRFPLRSVPARNGSAGVLPVNLKKGADVYVFCLFTNADRQTADPLDVSQWEFYVARSAALDSNFPLGKSIGLPGLQKLGAVKGGYKDLPACIDRSGPLQPARR